MKKFQIRQNHRAHLNKMINDNLREVQLLELQHQKELFELEMVSFEEISNKQISHDDIRDNLTLSHMSALNTVKEKELEKLEAKKKDIIMKQQDSEYKKLRMSQRLEMDHLNKRHGSLNQLNFKNTRRNSVAVVTNFSREASIDAEDNTMATSYSAVNVSPNSNERLGIDVSESDIHGTRTRESSAIGVDAETLNRSSSFSGNQASNDSQQSNHHDIQPISIHNLLKTQKKDIAVLEAEQCQEIKDCQQFYEAKLDDLADQHASSMASLHQQHLNRLEIMQEIQENEIIQEDTIHENENQMLKERRILNSVLETVTDGVICISPSGIIVRFNHAAELIFEWKASEVLGTNIKILVSTEHASNHDQYLTNYLTTGVRKVIGIGRKVTGMKKDRSKFPMHLALSEVKEFGEHLFTGIIHDLTNETRYEDRRKAIDKQKKAELQAVAKQLDSEKERISSLLSQILPSTVSSKLLNGLPVEPEVFENATILYFDIVGYTTIASQVQPLEIVSLLNQLYNSIDAVIERYNVYKVETVGKIKLKKGIAI